MYCSAVGTTLRAAPLAEVEVLTGQVVREVREGRGALGGTLDVRRVKTGDLERLPPKWNPIPTRYSIPRTNCESAALAVSARRRQRASPFTESMRPSPSCSPPP